MNTPKWLIEDQYGNHQVICTVHPRKHLLAQYGRQHASKIYVNDGEHVGYIIAGHWFSVSRLFPIETKYASIDLPIKASNAMLAFFSQSLTKI